MVTDPSDLHFYYSGGASKATFVGDQGGTKSSVQILDQDRDTTPFTKNTKWADLTPSQRANGLTQFHCYYLQNDSAQDIENLKLWFDGGESATGPGTIYLGYSGNPVNTQEEFITSDYDLIYNVPKSDSNSRLDNDREMVGQMITRDDSKLWNKTINRVWVWLERVGNLSGTVTVDIRSWDNPETTIEAINTMAASSVSTTPTLYLFENTGATYQMDVEDFVAIHYNDGTSSKYIRVYRETPSDVAHSHLVNYDGSQMRNVSDYDLSGSMYTAEAAAEFTAPAGITFTKPITRSEAIILPDLAIGDYIGFWERRKVSAEAGKFTGNLSQLVLEYDSDE